MSNILTKATVLVLNRNWQAINVRTPQEAFCMMATNVATGLEIEGEDHIRPVTWEEWITLPIREQDEAVHTVRGQIHVVPRSRGGKDVWENLVWSAKEVNQKKADRLPHEAGLKLLSVPRAPKEMPVSALIRNSHEVADWKLFIEA
jgi:hypothetical protein